MTNKELQTLLQAYPNDMPVKLMIDHSSQKLFDLTDENVMHTSETATFVEAEDDDDLDEWNLGDGQQYLLFNPIIL